MNRQRGFSLVEIMVVVAIIGVVASLATTSVTNWNSKTAFADQKAVLYDIVTRARNMANSRNECVKLSIDGQTIHVIGYAQGAAANCVDPLGAQSIALPDVEFKAGYTLETFSDGNTSLVFNTGGGLRTGNQLSIFLHDTNGMRQGFLIYPALGQIRNTN